MRKAEQAIKELEQIEELKMRRVALLKYSHTLKDDDPKKAECLDAARKLYDGLTGLGIKLI